MHSLSDYIIPKEKNISSKSSQHGQSPKGYATISLQPNELAPLQGQWPTVSHGETNSLGWKAC